jgi:hypothetical protein
MNPLKSLVAPKLPPAAIGLSGEGACAVALDRRRDLFAVKRAAFTPLPAGLLHPNFDESNVAGPAELAGVLAELVANVGMSKRRRWSVALPEAATRTAILTMEGGAASRTESEEMVRWKTERAIGATLDELRVARERLPADAAGRPRYLVSAVRLGVLAEYEAAFEALGWHAGLILPRHMGEAWWLMRGAARAAHEDSLLVSSHNEGFTAVIMRGTQPLLVRNVICDVEDRADELYRFLLFYRDRNASPAFEGEEAIERAAPAESIERLLVAGTGLDAAEVGGIVAETLQVPPRTLGPADVRLSFPSNEIDFRHLAAPAGLAALAWA